MKGRDKQKSEFAKKRVLMPAAEYGIIYTTGMKPLEAIGFAEREKGVGKGRERSVSRELYKMSYFSLTCFLPARETFLKH
jgi:hypothetical protein